MLIVNADDFGADAGATDATLDAMGEGLVSSTTAMVWMRDSERAAAIARERNLVAGLHLNFTLPYSDVNVPAPERERQLRLTDVLDREWMWVHPPPRLEKRLVHDVVADQLDRFRSQFGQPDHLDGHHHIHIHPVVLACLPHEIPIRPPIISPAAIKSPIPADIRKRFITSDLCLAFEAIHPALGGSGLDVLDEGLWRVIDVMVHPKMPGHGAALRSSFWREVLERIPLGTYGELSS